MTDPEKEQAADSQDPETAETAPEAGGEPEDSASQPEPSNPSEAPAAGTPQPEPSQDSATESQDADELPEWEPLTPELAEEEAMRNDLAIRWGVVCIAVLFGCMQIADSTSLVHIKSGEYLLQNGFLPPRHDVFSYAAKQANPDSEEAAAWVQLTWLFDLGAGALHRVQGMSVLVIAKALIAAIIFGVLVHLSIPRVPTWWGSVCAALALLACYPQFTLDPQLITLLGLTFTLKWLEQWKQSESTRIPWKIPILFVLWANLDDRMFLGLALVVLYAIGNALKSTSGEGGGFVGEKQKQLRVLVGACFVAALANPFLWQSITAPIDLYGAEYPAQRQYHVITSTTERGDEGLQYRSMFVAESWRLISHSTVAGLLAAIAAIGALYVNRERLDFGHVVALAGFVVIGFIANHEIAAMSIVAAVFATLNGQDWYRRNCRQEYSIEIRERAFSLGGRAVTVVALFVVAFLGASGHLAGREGARIGLGLDQNLQTVLEVMEQDLLTVEPEERVFNYTTEQGDIMIWLGRDVFIDNRSTVYARTEPSLIETHSTTRQATRESRGMDEISGNTEIWQKTFDDFNITCAMPRVYGPSIDVYTCFDLANSPDWKMRRLGGAAAIFQRVDPTRLDADTPGLDLVKQGFRTPDADLEPRTDWAREPTVYQKYLLPPQAKRTAPFLRARNFYWMLSQVPAESRLQFALAFLTIRNANHALVEEPQNVEAFTILGDTYSALRQLEAQFAGMRGGVAPINLRYHQAIAAYSQALTVDPKNLYVLDKLFKAYMSNGRVDLALDIADRWLEVVDVRDETFDGMLDARDQLFEQVETINERVEDALDKLPIDDEEAATEQRSQLAFAAYTQGYLLQALRLLDMEIDPSADLPEMQNLRGLVLLESGRVEEAYEVLGRLQAVAEEYPAQFAQLEWQFGAALSNLANGNYSTAEQIWAQKAQTLDSMSKMRLSGAMHPQVAPFSSPPRVWPMGQLQALTSAMVEVPNDVADSQFHTALAYLEEGRTGEAGALLENVVKLAGDTPIGPLAEFYYTQITEKTFEPEETEDPWEDLDDPELVLAAPATPGAAGPAAAGPAGPAPPTGQNAPSGSSPPDATAKEDTGDDSGNDGDGTK